MTLVSCVKLDHLYNTTDIGQLRTTIGYKIHVRNECMHIQLLPYWSEKQETVSISLIVTIA